MKSVSYPRTGKRGVPQQFPRRLYNMLESEAKFQHMANKDTQIKWSDSGCAFNILDVNLFSTQVLPKYFRTNKFSSFQRNLNLYGFCKVRRGPDADMYAHPSFKRGHPEILCHLTKCKSAADRKRQQAVQVNIQTASNPLQEILPAPVVLDGGTRAVSPSSSEEEQALSGSLMNTLPTTINHHPYVHQSHQRTLFNANASAAAAATKSHSSCPRYVTSSPQRCQNAKSQQTGRLDLLSLAVSFLADGNTASHA